MSDVKIDIEDILSRLDLGAIEPSSNKVAECQYFLGLASSEKDHAHFRWLISAFLNAAYSFFEMSAMRAYFAFTHPETGEMHEDGEAIEILEQYVGVSQEKTRPTYIKTWGTSDTTKKLYEFRKRNTHHYPLYIMKAGEDLPEDFHFGKMIGDGEPVLKFCSQAMALILQAQEELDA